ncbi:DUF2961 domain-containing protein [Prolixibacteraceae bacterium JC049]|nr:DUF2961 domain-containing protein [Prolixibacteraceae bacterium JC049]
MKKTLVRLILVQLLLTVMISSSCAQGKYTFESIANRYINLKQLATIPLQGEKSGMYSSYDRRSEFNEESGKYENWAANFDGDGYVRKDGDEYVLATIEGPGVITRFWSALPQKGELSIEIDGKEVLSMPAEHFFDGKHMPFNFPGFVYTTAKGKNNYTPISFQRSCKIKAKEKWGKFFQINYTQFPKGTEVPSFKGYFTLEEQRILESIQHQFSIQNINSGNKSKNEWVELLPGEEKQIFSNSGKNAITRMEIDVKGNDFLDNLIKNTELGIYWDNASRPAVKCPLGAFFGASVHDCKKLSEFKAVPVGIENTKMYANWYMPYTSNAKVMLKNKSNRKIKLSVKFVIEPVKIEKTNLTYFHVKWHDGLEPLEKERWPDRKLLDIKGKGRFCGMMLTVLNPISGIEYGYDLPKYNAQWWWGEGDEKFYVDGEKFPSTFGTGTEDYFGYAWGWPVRFSAPFHSQTYTTSEGLDENNAAHFVKNGNRLVSMNRFQIMDNVPFQRSFFATLEQYYPDKRPVHFQTALYYYVNKP